MKRHKCLQDPKNYSIQVYIRKYYMEVIIDMEKAGTYN